MKIGEVREFEGIKVRCVKELETCEHCFIYDTKYCCRYESSFGQCSCDEREDGEGIIFIGTNKKEKI